MGAALSSDTYSSNVLERRLLGGAVSRRPAEPAARHGAHAHVRRHPVRSSLCSDVHRVRVRMTYLQRRPRPHARTQVSPNVAQLVVLRRTFFSARRYASAAGLSLWPRVCMLSVTSQSSIETDERIKLGFLVQRLSSTYPTTYY